MKRVLFNVTLTFGLILGLVMTTSVNAQNSQLVIIGNLKSVPPEMDLDQLRSVLKGEQLRWDDGKKVTVAIMKTNTPVGIQTCERIYQMTVNGLKKHFAILTFQGTTKPPKYCNSLAEMEAFVAENPGAIGVVETTSSDLVQVIRIDGKNHL